MTIQKLMLFFSQPFVCNMPMKQFLQDLKDKIHEIEKKITPEVKRVEQEAEDAFMQKVEPILNKNLTSSKST
jgi:hypothetical protein